MAGHTLVLHGGPFDGQVVRNWDDLPSLWLVPAPVEWTVWALEGQDPSDLGMPVCVYELQYYQGRPSLDDRGQYRYRYDRTVKQ